LQPRHVIRQKSIEHFLQYAIKHGEAMARIELVSLSVKAADLDAFRYISTNGIIYF
jgi:hypothetical protein